MEKETNLAFWDDFLYEVNYNWSVILNRERSVTPFPAYPGQEGRGKNALKGLRHPLREEKRETMQDRPFRREVSNRNSSTPTL